METMKTKQYKRERPNHEESLDGLQDSRNLMSNKKVH